MRHPIAGLASWIVVCFVAAAIGGFASLDAKDFYASLALPSWAPPAGIFGPVWSVLYLMMAIAAWLAWKARGWNGARPALALFLVQLAVNALWSWLFFAWHRGALAFVDVILLWFLIAATIVAFWRIRPLAGALLLPYLAWVTFASALTFAVWQANPRLL